MPWNIEERKNAAVVTMNSNSVGTMNKSFFTDLNSAFSSLGQNHPGKPVVLSSGAKMFSPGLDLEQCVSLFRRGDKSEIDRWFNDFLNSMLTVFDYPAPVMAAIGGHAIAGGCILALCCDFRIAEKGKTLLGLNENSIGFPMPSSFSVLVTGVLGREKGNKIIDEGKLHSVESALENGIVNRIAESSGAVCVALEEAGKISLKDFTDEKKMRKDKISDSIKDAFINEDSKTLASKLSSPETVGKLEGLLEILKKGRKS